MYGPASYSRVTRAAAPARPSRPPAATRTWCVLSRGGIVTRIREGRVLAPIHVTASSDRSWTGVKRCGADLGHPRVSDVGDRHIAEGQADPGHTAPGRPGAASPGRAARLGGPALAAAYLLSALACCLRAAVSTADFVDLRVYRLGGKLTPHPGLYHAHYHGLPFTYPPFAAVVMAPLSRMPWLVAVSVLTAASVVALPLTLYLALRLPPGPAWLDRRGAVRLALAVAAAAIWLEPVRSELGFGQIDLLLAVGILVDLAAPRSARLRGALIGVAAGIKLTPAIFVVYLLATRRYKAAAVAAAAFAATVAVGFAIVPDSSVFYWDGAFLDPRRISSIQSGQNESLLGAIARNAHSTGVTGIWLPVAILTAVCGLAVAALAQRGGDEGLGFSVCAITGLLVSPISWTHHWVIAVPALLLAGVASYRGRGTRRRLATIAAAAAIAAVTVIGWSAVARHPGGDWLHAPPGRVALAEVYPLAGLGGLLVAAAVGWRRTRDRDGQVPPAGRAIGPGRGMPTAWTSQPNPPSPSASSSSASWDA
jgi:alpha-1,2-mannosyltransferase